MHPCANTAHPNSIRTLSNVSTLRMKRLTNLLNALNHSKKLKRAIDISVAGTTLVAVTPFLGLTAVVVAARVGWPPLFRQQRPGFAGQPFTLVKLRTMKDGWAPDGAQLPDAERLTPFGVWLRSTSLDELPELWNVLRGEMSLVGPRPLLEEYLPLYTSTQARRHTVPPGLTGWAQIRGRNALSWEEKFELDVWYVDNWSNALDLKILLATLSTVRSRSGIAADGEPTMPRYRGPRDEGEIAT